MLLCYLHCLLVALLLEVANNLILVVSVVFSYGLYLIQMIHLVQSMLVARLLVPYLNDLDACLSYCNCLRLLYLLTMCW
jgi:hypothetical protein